MSMRRLLLGLALLPCVVGAGAVFDAQPAAACSCVGVTDQQAFDSADAVFVGRVISYEPPPGHVDGSASSTDPALWTFKVRAVFKGDVRAIQGIVSEWFSASCGLEIPKSGDILVFARNKGSPGLSPTPGDGQYYAGLCGGTRPTSEGALQLGLAEPHRPRRGDGVDIRGEFVLANQRHWKRVDTQECSGRGLYRDVRRGTRIRVRDENSDVLATSTLSGGQRRAGCTFSFVIRDVPRRPSQLYTFEIGKPGKAGPVFRESWDSSGLERVDRMLTFRVG